MYRDLNGRLLDPFTPFKSNNHPSIRGCFFDSGVGWRLMGGSGNWGIVGHDRETPIGVIISELFFSYYSRVRGGCRCGDDVSIYCLGWMGASHVQPFFPTTTTATTATLRLDRLVFSSLSQCLPLSCVTRYSPLDTHSSSTRHSRSLNCPRPARSISPTRYSSDECGVACMLLRSCSLSLPLARSRSLSPSPFSLSSPYF